MNTRLLILIAALAASSTATLAVTDDGASVAARNGCTSCHAPGKPMIAPSFSRIAAVYRGKPDARQELAQSIKAGSRAKWGAMVMRPNRDLPDAETQVLVDWILAP